MNRNPTTGQFLKGHTPWSKGSTSSWSEESKEKARKSSVERESHKSLPFSKGDKNPSWKGDDVGYRGIHHWIRKEKGHPSICEHCGVIGQRPRQYHWSNISGNYLRDVSDWQQLCVKCHSKFDRK